METSAIGWPPWLITFWYLLISEQLYMLMHEAMTWFLQIQRYQNGINQGGHPIALVSMATTLCETRLLQVEFYERVQRKYQKKVGWDKHARPIPIKGGLSNCKTIKKEKERGGGASHLPMFTHTHTQKKKKKNIRSDTSDSLTVNWGGEKASPSFCSRLPPSQNLKIRRQTERKTSLPL